MHLVKPKSKGAKDKRILDTLSRGDLGSRNLLRMEYGLNVNLEDQGTPVEVHDMWSDKKSGIFNKTIGTVGVAGYVYPIITPKNQEEKAKFKTPEGKEIEIDITGLFQTHEDIIEGRPHANMNSIMHSSVGIAMGLGLTLLIGHSVNMQISDAMEGDFQKAINFAIGIPGWYLMSSARTKLFTDLFNFPFMKYSDTLGHEHVHIMQTEFDAKRTSFTTRKERHAAGDLDDYHIFGSPLKGHIAKSSLYQSKWSKRGENFVRFIEQALPRAGYYQEDCEIQARLHTILTKKAHDLPQNKYQLWATLLEAGLTAPKAIYDELKQHPEDAEKFGYKPKKNLGEKLSLVFKRHADRDVTGINFAYRAGLRPETKTFFWNVTLPYLYGHLLEIYADQGFELGNKDGRKMMGFKKSMDRQRKLPDSHVQPWGVQRTLSTPIPDREISLNPRGI